MAILMAIPVFLLLEVIFKGLLWLIGKTTTWMFGIQVSNFGEVVCWGMIGIIDLFILCFAIDYAKKIISAIAKWCHGKGKSDNQDKSS